MTSTLPPYEECNDYEPAKDDKYVTLNCTFENGLDICTQLVWLHKTTTLRTYVLGYIPLVFSVIGLIFNVVYASAIIAAFRKGGIVSKKRYCFLLNRTISDIFAVCLYYFVVVVWKVSEFSFSYAITAMFILIGGVSFLVLTGTYVAMTTVLYVAISRPLRFKQLITMRRCIYIIGAIWLVSLIFAAVCGPLGATLFFPDTSTIRCSYYECQRPLAFALVFVMCLCYGVVLLFYLVMLLKMRTGKVIHMIRSNSQRRNISVMNRLGLNIGTFAITCLPMALVCVLALSQLKTFSVLGEGQGRCKYIVHADLFFKLELLAGCGALMWVFRMLFDPVINSFNDPKFRKFILRRPIAVGSKEPPAPIEAVVLSPVGKGE